MRAMTKRQRLRRLNMYIRYGLELEQYFTEKAEDPEAECRKTFWQYLMSPGFIWHDVWDGGRPVGFVLTGHDLPHAHGKGLYICDAYVEPECRKQGRMSAAIKDILLRYADRPVYLEIFDDNHIAIAFWEAIFKEAGYCLCWAHGSEREPELCEYRYRKKGEADA